MSVMAQDPDAQAVFSFAFIESLVERIAAGDRDAMEELYRTLMRGLRGNLGRQLPAEMVEDRAHNVFLITVNAIRSGQIREPARLPGFIRTVTMRQAADAIRGLSRQRNQQVNPLDVALTDEREDPERSVEEQERRACLLAALQALSPRDREILVRFYLHEQDAERICGEMGLSPTQFRLFKSRAKARLGLAGRRGMASASAPASATARKFRVAQAS
jgi:RNA polymerase sigma-70 factor, ECF subfamily